MEVKDSNQINDISPTKNESLNQIENQDNKIEVIDTQNDKIQQEHIENNNEEEQKIKTEIKIKKKNSNNNYFNIINNCVSNHLCSIIYK